MYNNFTLLLSPARMSSDRIEMTVLVMFRNILMKTENTKYLLFGLNTTSSIFANFILEHVFKKEKEKQE